MADEPADRPRLLPPSLRPRLRELGYHGADGVWACPRCNCRDWRVIDTRQDHLSVRRVRVCRNCKQRLDTVELPRHLLDQ